MSTKGRGSLYKAKYRDRKTGESCESPYWSMSYQAYRDGKWRQVRKSTGETSKREAAKFLNEIMGEEDRQEHSTTLDDAFDFLREHYDAERQTSWDRVEQSAVHVRAFFGGDARLSSIDTDALLRFRAARLRETPRPTKNTVNHDLAYLRAAMRKAAIRGKLKTLPAFEAAKLTVKNGDKRQPRHISPAELEEIAAALPEYAELAIRFLYITGMRVRDALRLSWADVDQEDGWFRFYVSKTDEWRELPLIEPLGELVARLEAHRAMVARTTGRLSDRVFVNDAGKPMTYSRVRIPWERARHEGLRLHDLRASAVTNLHSAGIPDSQAMKWTGHRSVGVHAGYDVGSRVALAEIGRQYSRLLVGNE